MEDLKDQYEFISRVARLTQDPEEILQVINCVAKLEKGLTADMRSAFASGYQNLIHAKVSKWRIVSKIQYAGDRKFVALAKDYLKRLGGEITDKCNEILDTLNNYLLPSSNSGESGVLYYKLKADYHSILAEVSTRADLKETAISESIKAYEAATAIAKSDITSTNSISLRLGLALNFSGFLFDKMDDPERARKIATQAFEEAASEFDSLDLKSRHKCTLLMQKIEDNLAIWAPDPGEDDDLRPPPRPEWLDEADSADKQNKA